MSKALLIFCRFPVSDRAAGPSRGAGQPNFATPSALLRKLPTTRLPASDKAHCSCVARRMRKYRNSRDGCVEQLLRTPLRRRRPAVRREVSIGVLPTPVQGAGVPIRLAIFQFQAFKNGDWLRATALEARRRKPVAARCPSPFLNHAQFQDLLDKSLPALLRVVGPEVRLSILRGGAHQISSFPKKLLLEDFRPAHRGHHKKSPPPAPVPSATRHSTGGGLLRYRP